MKRSERRKLRRSTTSTCSSRRFVGNSGVELQANTRLVRVPMRTGFCGGGGSACLGFFGAFLPCGDLPFLPASCASRNSSSRWAHAASAAAFSAGLGPQQSRPSACAVNITPISNHLPDAIRFGEGSQNLCAPVSEARSVVRLRDSFVRVHWVASTVNVDVLRWKFGKRKKFLLFHGVSLMESFVLPRCSTRTTMTNPRKNSLQ